MNMHMHKHIRRITKHVMQTLYALCGLVLLVIALERPAAAYTDPGSGALILQMAGAAIVGGLFYFRKSLSFLRRFLTRSRESGNV